MRTNLHLGFMLCFAALTVSCNGLIASITKSGNSAVPDKPSSTSTQPSSNAREDIRSALTNLLAAKSFRAHLTNNGKHFMDLEYAAPDRFHLTGEDSGRQFPPGEMILIGRDTYVKADGKWQRSPPGMSFGDQVARLGRPDVTQEMAKYIEVSYVGTDSLDGAPMLVYQYKKNEDQGQPTSGRIWIGSTDHLPYRFEYQGKGVNGDDMIVNYDYPSDIKIEPPA
jgi:hypothetical protein